MKINPSVGYGHYQNYLQTVKNSEAVSGKAAVDNKTAPGAAAAANTDKVQISADAAARAERSRLAEELAGEVEGTANPARLDELRGAVQGGTYSVPAEKLAEAVLGLGW